ncbi:hypothetical protein Poli38472_002442 [Pythium oligandrum]|uniref:Uncharacterized protein n=1 Tax=Pythium oligandrum TaxID=41045 RepID=A0A8K1CH81_PYTOL|nr:hypothetical protein Poli38472_002442 [Pythium oligandrum]|eukprot:TMW63501.1 hypothetical protein Poli38472_002442 [Pythium oligandrum]
MTGTHDGRALIFDLDGTLIDLEPISVKSIGAVIADHGGEYTLRHHKMILGRARAQWTRVLVDEIGLHDRITPHDLGEKAEAKLKESYHEAAVLPGVIELLKKMKAKGIPMAIGTSSGQDAVAAKRTHHPELFSFFDIVVCGDDKDVKFGKPAPDIFVTAGRRLLGDDFDASKCVVFEDSPNGVAAARAAGMKVMALPDGRFYTEDEEKAHKFSEADEILSSILAFDETKYGFQ